MGQVTVQDDTEQHPAGRPPSDSIPLLASGGGVVPSPHIFPSLRRLQQAGPLEMWGYSGLRKLTTLVLAPLIFHHAPPLGVKMEEMGCWRT